MATKKISELTELTSPAGTEELIINAGGTSKKITLANLPDNDTVYAHPNHSGDVTSTADGATVITAGAVDTAMLSATLGDLRGRGITHVGRDTNDYIHIDVAHVRFYINGVNVMSVDASGNAIFKGTVSSNGTPA